MGRLDEIRKNSQDSGEICQYDAAWLLETLEESYVSIPVGKPTNLWDYEGNFFSYGGVIYMAAFQDSDLSWVDFRGNKFTEYLKNGQYVMDLTVQPIKMVKGLEL